MSAQSIIEQLQDVETAFEKLEEVYDIDNNRFTQARDLLRFQARKQEYKKLRDDTWRWLKNHGVNPEERDDYERGWYHLGYYAHDTAVDNPFRWAAQAFYVRVELQAQQHNLPVSSVAQNLYLINFTGLTRQPSPIY